MAVIHLNNNFNEEVKNYNGIVVVDFWATWCGPCRMFGPVFENVSDQYEDIKFCKLDVDEDQEGICKEFGVMSIPTIVVIKNGQEVNRNVGVVSKSQILEMVK